VQRQLWRIKKWGRRRRWGGDDAGRVELGLVMKDHLLLRVCTRTGRLGLSWGVGDHVLEQRVLHRIRGQRRHMVRSRMGEGGRGGAGAVVHVEWLQHGTQSRGPAEEQTADEGGGNKRIKKEARIDRRMAAGRNF